jgi:hypothetical protein
MSQRMKAPAVMVIAPSTSAAFIWQFTQAGQ